MSRIESWLLRRVVGRMSESVARFRGLGYWANLVRLARSASENKEEGGNDAPVVSEDVKMESSGV